MKVKVGQYVRVDNMIMVCNDNTNEVYELENKTDLYAIPLEEWGNFQVADTPMELVQVGDLVEYIDFVDGETYVILLKEDDLDFLEYTTIDIKAIYTPNADKTVFTQQWRKEVLSND